MLAPLTLNDCLNIADLRKLARRRAHHSVFDYMDGGADDETTLSDNSAAFQDYRLLHRTLAGVEAPDLSTTVLRQPIDVPFFLSPSAGNRMFHTAGERAVARAAARAGTVYCLSTLASVSIEDIAAETDGPKWFQLYVWKDRGLIREMLQRAKSSGYGALILTADLPVHGNRERDPRNGFTIPPTIGPRQVISALMSPTWTIDYLKGPPIAFANLAEHGAATTLHDFVAAQLHAGFNWKDAEWLLGEWAGPAVLKGVVRTDDAKRAVAAGFNALMISNHGGRQLDGSIAPITALPLIADAVGDRAELIVDGGVRRGTDILKALALGAKAVSFARPYLYGLAAAGEAGVDKALSFFVESLNRDMTLLGARAVGEIERTSIRAAR